MLHKIFLPLEGAVPLLETRYFPQSVQYRPRNDSVTIRQCVQYLVIHPSTRPQKPPTTGNDKKAAAARFQSTLPDGQNVASPWPQTITTKLAYPPIPSATHQGQCGGLELWTLHEVAAPFHQERQPQSNKRLQALIKNANVTPAATRKTADLAISP